MQRRRKKLKRKKKQTNTNKKYTHCGRILASFHVNRLCEMHHCQREHFHWTNFHSINFSKNKKNISENLWNSKLFIFFSLFIWINVNYLNVHPHCIFHSFHIFHCEPLDFFMCNKQTYTNVWHIMLHFRSMFSNIDSLDKIENCHYYCAKKYIKLKESKT